LSAGKGRAALKADNLTRICEPNVYVGASPSMGLHGLLQGEFFLLSAFINMPKLWIMTKKRVCVFHIVLKYTVTFLQTPLSG
jgi:hypothetical protein